MPIAQKVFSRKCVIAFHVIYFLRSDIYYKHPLVSLNHQDLSIMSFLPDFLAYFYFQPVTPQSRGLSTSLLLNPTKIYLYFLMKKSQSPQSLGPRSLMHEKEIHDVDLIVLRRSHLARLSLAPFCYGVNALMVNSG